MKKVGIDLGKKQSDVCVIDEERRVAERFRVRTTRSGLSAKFANREACEIGIESCRDAGWVCEHLTGLGHKVVVIDTSRARAIGIGVGRRKTDRRDAELIARALVAGVAPPAHVLSREARELRDVLSSRDQLVRVRGRLVTMVRGQFQGRGHEVPRCETERFTVRMRASGVPGVESIATQAVLQAIDGLNEQLAVLEEQLRRLAEKQEAFERLCSVPGVKMIVTLAFLAALDDGQRFAGPHEVQAFLGLVPSEYSTGGKRRLGRITRCGNHLARRMLVQAAQALLRTKKAQADPLVVWAKQVQERRGKKKAVVALARRLAGVLWAMWMDGTFYDPKGLARASFAGLSRAARRAEAEARRMKQAVVAAPRITAAL
jgi:transposase